MKEEAKASEKHTNNGSMASTTNETNSVVISATHVASNRDTTRGLKSMETRCADEPMAI